MADEAGTTVSSVAETSPVSVESPADAGLGATEAQKEQPSKSEDAYRKLQARLDRAERRREEAEAEASRAYQMIGDSRSRTSFQEEIARAPDKYSNPDEHSRYITAVAMKWFQKLSDERIQANQQTDKVKRTWEKIDAHIAELNAEYGVQLTRDDEDIIVNSGERVFRATAKARAKEAKLLRELAEARGSATDTLREAGIDRFDGGGGSCGGVAGPMSFDRWQSMSWADRQDYRRNKPDAIRDMERRMGRGA